MSKPASIQITVPHPCSQNLDEMAATPEGRFCTHCQKNVIDFSEWSDTALYNFFSKNKEQVCGRFSPTQLERPIHIPYQPHSKLYRITIAFGLTLLFTQTPNLLAQNRPPKTEQTSVLKQPEPANNNPTGIGGRILNDKKEPAMNAEVKVYQYGNLKGSTRTDNDGNYRVQKLEPGYYDLTVEYNGYKEPKITAIIVVPGNRTTQNIILQPKQYSGTEVVVTAYRRPLVDGGSYTRSVLTADEIKTIPIGEANSAMALPGYQKTKNTADGQKNILAPEPINICPIPATQDFDEPGRKTFTREEIKHMPY